MQLQFYLSCLTEEQFYSLNICISIIILILNPIHDNRASLRLIRDQLGYVFVTPSYCYYALLLLRLLTAIASHCYYGFLLIVVRTLWRCGGSNWAGHRMPRELDGIGSGSVLHVSPLKILRLVQGDNETIYCIVHGAPL